MRPQQEIQTQQRSRKRTPGPTAKRVNIQPGRRVHRNFAPLQILCHVARPPRLLMHSCKQISHLCTIKPLFRKADRGKAISAGLPLELGPARQVQQATAGRADRTVSPRARLSLRGRTDRQRPVCLTWCLWLLYASPAWRPLSQSRRQHMQPYPQIMAASPAKPEHPVAIRGKGELQTKRSGYDGQRAVARLPKGKRVR